MIVGRHLKLNRIQIHNVGMFIVRNQRPTLNWWDSYTDSDRGDWKEETRSDTRPAAAATTTRTSV